MAGRLERRSLSSGTLADALDSFKSSLSAVPIFGAPKHVEENTTGYAGELVIVNTGTSKTIQVRIADGMRPGQGLWVINNGGGTVRIRVPSGSEFIDGSPLTSLTTDYDMVTIIKLSDKKFVHSL